MEPEREQENCSELVEHIAETIGDVNVPSIIMGLTALAVLLVSRRFIPKFPMAICVMTAGALLSCVIDMDEYGIVCLSEVSRGLPQIVVPQIDERMLPNIMTVSLSIAVVIMAETLLAENNFAQKNRYKIDDNQELLAFGGKSCSGIHRLLSNKRFRVQNHNE